MKNKVEKDKKSKKKVLKIVLIAAVAVVFVAVAVLVGFSVYGKQQMKKIPSLTFEDALLYTTDGNKDAVITVGTIVNGEISYTVYGENGKVLSPDVNTYEIGSLTKTFTAALVQKGVAEGKIELEKTIDNYLSLPAGKTYPTVKELLTHTSGYKGFYFESPMVGNFFAGRNDFCGIGTDKILSRVGKLNVKKESYSYKYSNFGYAVLGLVLEAVNDTDYETLVNEFAATELGLSDTQISDGSGNLGKLWDWKKNDGYRAAGALTSTITDMLEYAKLQLEDERFAPCRESLAVINASTPDNAMMNIHLDEIGMGWILDTHNGFVWHNGATGDYNSYLGVNPQNGTAVVVLSNLAHDYRIPATVLGVKLLASLA